MNAPSEALMRDPRTNPALTRREVLESAGWVGAGAALATSLRGGRAMAAEPSTPRLPRRARDQAPALRSHQAQGTLGEAAHLAPPEQLQRRGEAPEPDPATARFTARGRRALSSRVTEARGADRLELDGPPRA